MPSLGGFSYVHLIAKNSVSSVQVYIKVSIATKIATILGTQQSFALSGVPVQGHPISLALGINLTELINWVSIRTAHHREMDNNAIACLEELKIVWHCLAERAIGWHSLSPAHKTMRTYFRLWQRIRRIKSEAKITEKFALNEKWPS